MTLSQLVSNVKRLGQFGDPSVTTDQITTDIINFVNNRMYEFWSAWPWPWLLTPISIATTIGTTDYTLPSTIGNIEVLQVGNNPSLVQLSLKEYYDWTLNQQIDPVTGLATVPANGDITNYVIIGRDSSGNIQLRFWRPPSLAVTVVGFGKKRITTHLVADIASGIVLNSFPAETHPALQEGVLSDVYEESGQKPLSEATEKHFYELIEQFKSSLTIGDNDSQTTPPPDEWRWRNRQRGRGTSVV